MLEWEHMPGGSERFKRYKCPYLRIAVSAFVGNRDMNEELKHRQNSVSVGYSYYLSIYPLSHRNHVLTSSHIIPTHVFGFHQMTDNRMGHKSE